MNHSLASAALIMFTAASLSAQGHADPDKLVADGGVNVPGWTGRLDPRPTAQGRKITEAKFFTMGSGIHITTGPAAIYWNPANTLPDNYTVQATFVQQGASAHPEAYGLFLGGQKLETPDQSYLYFIVRQDGKFMINHRANDSTVHKMVDWTVNAAVKAVDDKGNSSNMVAVVVNATKLSFQVNGTEVHSIDRSVIDGGGPRSGTSGIAGIRVNHNLNVHVNGFAVVPAT